ncbi:hypothetical protein NKI41_25655 [Mesorhizobium sp. M0601]|uniref:hypothetical protein n=1 Tax=Mesorhizobium sp. M0601 TaxID=2956969 RepID=UPI0033368DAD
MKQILFFALKGDLLPVLEAVELEISVKYIFMVIFPRWSSTLLAIECKFQLLGNQPQDRLPAVEHFLSPATLCPLR